MLVSKIKDLKLRQSFLKLEFSKKVTKFLAINLLSKKKLTSKNTLMVQSLALRLNSRVSKLRLKNRCLLSNRNKGVSKQYTLSRIVMRELIQFGIIPGYTKAVW